jgi:hypothetical protein
MAEDGDSSGGRYPSMRKNSGANPAAFLSEIVQYWTAIYPELTHHQQGYFWQTITRKSERSRK